MKDRSLRLLAAAKINLTLDILGRREDGYHLMQMVMQSVSLYDRVTLSLLEVPGIFLTCSHPGIPQDQRNIAWKAAAAFHRAAGTDPAVAIRIEKQIPSQAGLAGGSADGAAVLVGLNRLYGSPLSPGELCAVGVTVGADLPFCIVGGTQLTEGIGEKLTPLPPLPDGWFVIAKPAQGVPTGPCFQRFDQLKPENVLHPDNRKMLRALAEGNFPGAAAQMGNVLELAAQCPAVALLRGQMEAAGALGCCMTGSGSAVTAAFAKKEPALRCLEAVRKHCESAFLVRPVPYGVLIQE